MLLAGRRFSVSA